MEVTCTCPLYNTWLHVAADVSAMFSQVTRDGCLFHGVFSERSKADEFHYYLLQVSFEVELLLHSHKTKREWEVRLLRITHALFKIVMTVRAH